MGWSYLIMIFVALLNDLVKKKLATGEERN
jgi:hypothetical protein